MSIVSPHLIHILSIIWHISLSNGWHWSLIESPPFTILSPSPPTSSSILWSASVISGRWANAARTKSRTFSKCFWKRMAVSIRVRFCTSISTRSVSRAWCGRNSFSKWCMCTNNKLKSSIFSMRFGLSGYLISKSIKSKKFANNEWFNFFNSLRRSKCCGIRRRIPWLSSERIISSLLKVLPNIWYVSKMGGGGFGARFFRIFSSV